MFNDWLTRRMMGGAAAEVDYSLIPMTIEAVTAGTLSVNNTNSYARSIEYSLNGGAWTAVTISGGAGTVTVAALAVGDKLAVRRDDNNFQGAKFVCDGTLTFNVYGNAMSMQYAGNFVGKTTIRDNRTNCMQGMFSGAKVIDASNLILPATTLTNDCYHDMFSNCAFLEKAPELPATTLANSCYVGMFYGCTMLTSAPASLPATSLANQCYYGMFQGCRNMKYVKCLATNISAYNCVTNWLLGVAATGTFVKAPGVTWPTGDSGIPSGWTVVDDTE